MTGYCDGCGNTLCICDDDGASLPTGWELAEGQLKMMTVELSGANDREQELQRQVDELAGMYEGRVEACRWRDVAIANKDAVIKESADALTSLADSLRGYEPFDGAEARLLESAVDLIDATLLILSRDTSG